MREVKKASSLWGAEKYERFGWQAGFAAFAVSNGDMQIVKAYIAGQEEHHKRVSSQDELRRLLDENGIEYDERFFE